MFLKRFFLFVCTASLFVGTFCQAEEQEAAVTSEEKEKSTEQEHVIEVKNEYEVDENYEIRVENLVGDLTVEFSEENKVVSTTSIHAFGSTLQKAKELAQSIQIKVEGDRKKVSLIASYPVLERSFYYYPFREKAGRKSGSQKNKKKVHYQERELTLLADPTPLTSHVYVDIHLRLPKHARASLKNLVGLITVKGVQGEVHVETTLATIQVEKGVGKLFFSNACGFVDIDNHTGEINGYTGSGKVHLESCQGSLCHVSSGSGTMVIEKCEYIKSSIENGSGTVSFKKTVGDVSVITGSGKVSLDDVVTGKMLKIETGSGSVKFKGETEHLEALLIQTGSGSVSFTATPFPKILFDIMSGSGDIAVSSSEIKIGSSTERSFMEMGKETCKGAVIRTGSGDIKLATSKKVASLKEKGKSKTY
ncbi:MAG: hypothetical protein JWO53_181 [Chlamydiia bacterium]|nr:hypothetical protein [Chlamydiia bacterium]